MRYEFVGCCWLCYQQVTPYTICVVRSPVGAALVRDKEKKKERLI